MLKYNLRRLFSLKGVNKPIGFLMKAGFTRSVASRLAHGKVSSISDKQLEKLCLTFKCTPNDLMEWTPNIPAETYKHQPLAKLINTTPANLDLRNVGDEIPFEMLASFAEQVNNLKNELLAK
jgi:DNA-binding Xre family transcriptional regulator